MHEKPKAFGHTLFPLVTVLVMLMHVPGCTSSKGGERTPAEPQPAPVVTPTPEQGDRKPDAAEKLARMQQDAERAVRQREEPKVDRQEFARSAESVARADLLACRHPDAKLLKGGDADVEEFARMLHGTWANQNRRTVHGMPVETDTVFYIDMKAKTAILIDRNNVGEGTMVAPFKGTGRFAKATAVKRPLSMTFVNCKYQFYDQYIKISDEVHPEALAQTTSLQLTKAGNSSLRDVWKQLVETRYFDSLEMPTSVKGDRKKVSARLGDQQRLAILPDGSVVSERDIEEGNAPGAEYELPMITGALFQISLAPLEGGGRKFRGVAMQWDAEYRGVGIGMALGEGISGIERGEFVREGNAYVSSIATSGPNTWQTSECGSKNELLSLEAPASSAMPGHEGHMHEAMVFDRVVIGLP